MNTQTLSYIETAGTIAFFILYAVKCYLAFNKKAFLKVGRVSMFTTSLFIFFLAVLRIVRINNMASAQDLRLMASIAAFIPLTITVIWLFFARYEEKQPPITN